MAKRNRLRGEQRKILLNDPCVYCYSPAREIDHIIPVTKGGSNGWDNSAPICTRCNTRKGAMKPIQFIIYFHWFTLYKDKLGKKKAHRLALEKLNGN